MNLSVSTKTKIAATRRPRVQSFSARRVNSALIGTANRFAKRLAVETARMMDEDEAFEAQARQWELEQGYESSLRFGFAKGAQVGA